MKRTWLLAGFVAALAMVMTSYAPAAYAGGPNLGKALGHLGKVRGLNLRNLGGHQGRGLAALGALNGLGGHGRHGGFNGLNALGNLGGRHGGFNGLNALGGLGGFGGFNPYGDFWRGDHHEHHNDDSALIAAGLAGVVLGGLGGMIAADRPFGAPAPGYAAPYAYPAYPAQAAPVYSAPQTVQPAPQGHWVRREVVDQPARVEKQKVWIPETHDAAGNKTGGGFYEMQTQVIPEQTHYEDIFVTP